MEPFIIKLQKLCFYDSLFWIFPWKTVNLDISLKSAAGIADVSVI